MLTENSVRWNAFLMENIIKSENSLSQDAKKTKSLSMLKKGLDEVI